MQRGRRAFTVVELVTVGAIIALLVAIFIPAIAKARDAMLTTRSEANLRTLAAANDAYGVDWNGRQYTACPDDMGLAPGGTAMAKCTFYTHQIACPAQQILGWDTGGGLWGYWIGTGLCPSTIPTDCSNGVAIFPVEYVGWHHFFGSFRLCSVKAFHDYLNGRYYDRVFFAPKDQLVLERVQPGLQNDGEFSLLPGVALGITFPTYVWSPAAMFAPDVLSSEDGYQSPYGVTLPGAFRSPSVGQAAFPDLKTRMVEHHWLQNMDGGARNGGWNPQPWWWNDTPVLNDAPPWTFNQGSNSAPVTLFFDGHVTLLPCAKAIASDQRVMDQQSGTNLVEKGLWVRGSPMGAKGYFGNQAFDQEIFDRPSSFHILTTDGIVGRDIIGDR